MNTETILSLKSNAIKTNSSYGNWLVYADTQFNNKLLTKPYYFFTKKKAEQFIEDCTNNGITY